MVDLAITPGEVADAIVSHRPSLAMILVDDDLQHALDLLVEIRSFAELPVVLMAHSIDEETLAAAADAAVEILHLPGAPETIARVIQLAVRRHQSRNEMERRLGDFDGILERRTTIEQAKGILMERHGIDAAAAFGRIRSHARENQTRVVDVAASIVTAHSLLPADPDAGSVV